jgi:hypothetical protein
MLHLNKTHNLEDNPDNHGLELNKIPRDKYKEGALSRFTKEKLLYKCRKMFHESMFHISFSNFHRYQNYLKRIHRSTHSTFL